jgi:hypothetical protein
MKNIPLRTATGYLLPCRKSKRLSSEEDRDLEGACTSMKIRGLLLAFTAIALFSCQKPPQADIDSAAKAYESSASDPDVVMYAPDLLRDAQTRLAALRAEVDAQEKKGSLSRRFEKTITLAAEAKAAAEAAVSEAKKAKEQVKADADALLQGFEAAISQYESKLWSAKRVRGIKLDEDLLTLAQGARTAVADALKDFETGSYAAAKAKALTIQERLADGESRVAEAVRLIKRK